MKGRFGRSGSKRFVVATLVAVIGGSASCATDDPAGVAPQDAEALRKPRVSVSADSTGNPPDDNCRWVDGQWICVP